MNLEDLVPALTRETLAREGLHKIAGAMNDVPELTIKEATRIIGTKAYLRRKEARLMVTGIAAAATLAGEKIANPLMQALGQRAVMPALMGAGIGGVAHMMNHDPNKGSMLPALLAGGGLGAVAGNLQALNAVGNSGIGQHAAHVVQNFDKMKVL